MNVPGYPRFTTKLSNQSVCEGSSTSISARVEGYPAPHVSWSHNGKPIQAEAGRVNLVFDGINATVEILNAFPDYEGEWTCSAFNSGMFFKIYCMIIQVLYGSNHEFM